MCCSHSFIAGCNSANNVSRKHGSLSRLSPHYLLKALLQSFGAKLDIHQYSRKPTSSRSDLMYSLTSTRTVLVLIAVTVFCGLTLIAAMVRRHMLSSGITSNSSVGIFVSSFDAMPSFTQEFQQ